MYISGEEGTGPYVLHTVVRLPTYLIRRADIRLNSLSPLPYSQSDQTMYVL